MRVVVAALMITLAAPVVLGQPVNVHQACLERRRELMIQATREEDPDLRQTLIDRLPKCDTDAEQNEPFDPYQDCELRRHVQMFEAMKIADVHARGRALASVPECRRRADGGVDEIVAMPPPAAAPPSEAPELSPRIEVAGRLGYGTWSEIETYHLPSGAAWYGELEVGYRARMWLSFDAFAGFSALDGQVAYAMPFQVTSPYPFNEHVYDAGVRLRAYRTFLEGGVGIGIERRDASGMSPGFNFDGSSSFALITTEVGTSFELGDARRLGIVASAAVATDFIELAGSLRIAVVLRL